MIDCGSTSSRATTTIADSRECQRPGRWKRPVVSCSEREMIGAYWKVPPHERLTPRPRTCSQSKVRRTAPPSFDRPVPMVRRVPRAPFQRCPFDRAPWKSRIQSSNGSISRHRPSMERDRKGIEARSEKRRSLVPRHSGLATYSSLRSIRRDRFHSRHRLACSL